MTTGRWMVLTLWLIAAAVVTIFPPAERAAGGGFGDLLPLDSTVLQVQQRILNEFRVPVLSGTTVVVHQPGGLSLLTRADSVLWALATTQDKVEGRVPEAPGHLAAAIPVPTGTAELTVTYLYVSDGTGLQNTVRLAERYAEHFHNQPLVETYVTGFVPAQVAQGHHLRANIGLFEIASVVLILLVVAMAFRSLLAPLAVLAIAAVGYLVYLPVLDMAAHAMGFEVPRHLEPVLLALLLGLITDYCVLFFSSLRDEVEAGADSVQGTHRALRRDAPIVAVAGLTVAGGTISLLAAPFQIFRALGPALALTVLVGLAVCLTLTPAVMSILGLRLFTALPVRGSSIQHVPLTDQAAPDERERPGRGIELLTARGPALAATIAVVVLLALAAVPLAQARLDLSFTAALPKDDTVAQGAQLLDDHGLRGISAPTEVLVEQDGITSQRAALSHLESLIAGQPGVVRVLGSADLPVSEGQGVVLAKSGDAARYVVVYDTDPLAAEAIGHVRELQERLPSLARDAGLPSASISVTGQTVIASEVAQLTRASLEATLLTALLVELLILILYLRALVAPVVLLACSALSVIAALGLTTLLFQIALGQGLTFYAPFAAAVLLIALGSDYNVFAVASIWEEGSRRTLIDALRVAVPRTAWAITIAGVILAGTFALVAIIPLSTFRQIAFAMTIGLILDTLVVRPVLTPAVLTLLGRTASWPSRRFATGAKR
jgi:RND superfamily putative drug exporter